MSDIGNPVFNRNERRGNYRGRRPYFRGRFKGHYNGGRSKNSDRPRPDPVEEQAMSSDTDLSGILAERAEVVDVEIQNCSSGPYTAWNLYLNNETYNEKGPIVQKLKAIEKYLRHNWSSFNREEIEIKASFTVSVEDLIADRSILETWPDIYNDIKETPESVMSYFGLAMHQLMMEEMKNDMNNQLQHVQDLSVHKVPQAYHLPPLFVRFLNFQPVLMIQKIKSNCFKRFVSVKGTVVKVSCIKPLCTKLAFKCFRCQTVQLLTQPYGKYIVPSRCVLRACNSHSFEPLRSSPLTDTVDWQCIRLQEMKDDDRQNAGSMPRTIRCELMHDLVDTCVPGDEVIISGVVKVMESEENAGNYKRGGKDQCRFLLYISANSINKCKSLHATTEFKTDFTVKELYAIRAIQAEENLLRVMTASLCPSIYGHEMIKAGFILGLFGGTQKHLDDENKIPVRGDPHVLVVGDPGLGKSQMLQSCSAVAPRGVYVCGNTTTTSGLTVTLNREGSSGDYSLEAGALVLSDQGCCCIDEFDKMTTQRGALLEAMEQQSISLAKAGMVCSLPARASILAAANPVGGHYNKAKTVAENLKMGSALLSRFDLVFILLDKPDEETDSKLSEHIMALHAGKQVNKDSATRSRLSILSTPTTSQCGSGLNEKTLRQRLKYGPNEICDPIPHQLLRKYISYAKIYVHPKISAEAAQQLQTFYLELRKRLQTSDSTPITTRQLESLIRLTEARAKLELREVCTREDANDVIEIMRHSMADVWSDDTGFMDILRSQHGSGMSGRSQAKRFVVALTRVAERTYNSLFSMQQMRQIAKDISIQIVDFESFIGSLNNQGFLLKKGPKVYQLLTTDY